MKIPRSILFFALLPVWACGALAGPADVADTVREWRENNEQAIVDRFATLLSIPNVARDTANIRRNAELIRDMLSAAGLDAELLEAEGGNPAVFGQRLVPGATRTVLIYAHYDGQPVNPDDWASDPWTPVMRDGPVEAGGQSVPMHTPFNPEWRIFARSAGDDKAPIVALQSALLALQAAGLAPSVNLKVFMEGEEEAGSPGLQPMLERYRDRLQADLWLFCDGPVHQSRRWQLAYGARGADGFDLTVYGPNRPLHSGHYGNWAPNPIMRLIELVDSMRDAGGHVLIDGFYDQVRPLTPAEHAAIDAAPRMDELLTKEFGIGAPETSDRLELAIARPALNLRGISAGGVGAQSRNAIPVAARASIGLRLVPNQTIQRMHQLIERHIRDQGYHLVQREPTAQERAQYPRLARVAWEAGGYPSYRTDFDNPMASKVAGLLDALSDHTLVQQPTLGGSLPLYIVDQVLHAPILILPVANHDDNQHGANENLRLKNLWDAIEIYAVVLTGL